MRIAPIISLGLSVVVGIGAIVLGRVWLTGNSDAATAAIASVTPSVSARKIETTEIAVLTVNLDIGEPLDLEKIEFVDWPTRYMPEGTITERAQLINADGSTPFARGVILAGEPLLMDKLSVQPILRKLAKRIEPGKRAISIKVTPDTGVSGLVLPGDFVDILTIRTFTNPTTNESSSSVRTVLRNVKVLAADQAFNTNLNGARVSRNVTVEVSTSDAARLALAEERGKLFLTLRAEDQEAAPAPAPRVAPRPRPLPAPVPQPQPAPTQSFTNVRIIQGDRANIVQAPVADESSSRPVVLFTAPPSQPERTQAPVNRPPLVLSPPPADQINQPQGDLPPFPAVINEEP